VRNCADVDGPHAVSSSCDSTTTAAARTSFRNDDQPLNWERRLPDRLGRRPVRTRFDRRPDANGADASRALSQAPDLAIWIAKTLGHDRSGLVAASASAMIACGARRHLDTAFPNIRLERQQQQRRRPSLVCCSWAGLMLAEVRVATVERPIVRRRKKYVLTFQRWEAPSRPTDKEPAARAGNEGHESEHSRECRRDKPTY
jgi:hypothetical protein